MQAAAGFSAPADKAAKVMSPAKAAANFRLLALMQTAPAKRGRPPKNEQGCKARSSSSKRATGNRKKPVGSQLCGPHAAFATPSAIADDIKSFTNLPGSALLSFTVGVGQQLSARLGLLSYARLQSHDRAGQVASITDVRDVTQIQATAVADAVDHLLAIEQVLFARLSRYDRSVDDHAAFACACDICPFYRDS